MFVIHRLTESATSTHADKGDTTLVATTETAHELDETPRQRTPPFQLRLLSILCQ